MDYLRTLGSAAVSSLVQKSGLNLPFSLGPKVASFENRTIWSLYDGTKKDDGSPVSLFEFEANTPAKKNLLPLAKNALRKLRTIRHPDVLKLMEVVETDTTIHIMTERVRPLGPAITEWQSKSAQEREGWLVWGLHRVSVALAFLNDSASSTHGNVRVDSVFISASGEWKLGGFDVLSNPKDDAAVLYSLGGMVPDASTYSSPEVKKGGYSSLKELPTSAPDAYGLGLLIHFAFNPNQALPATAQPPHSPPTAASRGAIPTSIFPSYKKLLNPNSKARLSPAYFLELGMSQTAGEGSGFFSTNRLVIVCAGLDNFNLASESEKATLLKSLKESASSFPTEFASYKVLPALISALEFGGASAANIVPLVLQFGKNIPPDDYPTVILTHLVKLFASADRGIRMALLDHLSEYSDKLDKKTVSDKIWPNLQTGFGDTVAVIREATVKAIILLSDKLNERIMNNDLLRHLARMQADPEASIRTNTCILIGRLGPSLGYNTKRKVLVPAFARALKDPFEHARVAGLMAFMATIDCFDIDDIASKVIPSMSFTLLDKEKLVRDQAFKAMELFLKKLEEHAATMASPLPLPSSIASGTLQSTVASTLGASIDRPTSAPPANTGNTLATSSTSGGSSGTNIGTLKMLNDAGNVQGATSTSKGKAMQLGATKLPTSASSSIPDWAEEAAADVDTSTGTNPWGNDDLMDVNADEDDWSAFETAAPAAPAPSEPTDFGFGNVRSPDPWSAPATKPPVAPQPRLSTVVSPLASPRPVSIARSITPSDSGKPETVSTPSATSTAGMSKEEKAAEMARRKEERKQRIAALKEQKKAKS
ncbi:armadillo-type protein [Ganoderma leucocontextum]|nr:armadillo-type protein [Ganoderma leucocontextum]